MKEAFELGGDFHSRTAMGMYDHIKADVELGKTHPTEGKVGNYWQEAEVARACGLITH